MMMPMARKTMGKRPRTMRMRLPRNIPMTRKTTPLTTSSWVSRVSTLASPFHGELLRYLDLAEDLVE